MELPSRPLGPSEEREPCPALLKRLREHGVKSLTDAELLAVVICGAVSEQHAWTVSSRLYDRSGRSFNGLRWLTQLELMRRHSLTERQAATLMAALEMGRRRQDEPVAERSLVSTSAAAHEQIKGALADLPHEEFWLLLMDRGCRLLDRVRVSQGGMHGTVADPKMIFKTALDHRASCLVLAHNHPSGQLRPSEEDVRLTKKLVEGGRLLDIAVQDHLIVALTGYYSFADNGTLP
jgi:DNA repair protein RadC